MKHLLSFFLLFLCNIITAQTDCIKINHILVDACGPEEGLNELFTFTTDNEIIVNNIDIDWPNTSATFQGFVQNNTTTTKVTTFNTHILNSGGCGELLQPTEGIIPAGSKVVVFTSHLVVTDNLFGALDETWYVLFQNNNNFSSGHFANYSNSNNNPYRTLDISVGDCSDSATYDRRLLNNIDGASVDFMGVEPSYYTQGCEPLFSPLSVDAGENITACAGATISLNGSSVGFDVFEWTSSVGTFGDSSSLTSTFTIPSDFQSGTLILTLSANKSACSDNTPETDTLTITVSELPEIEYEVKNHDCVTQGTVTITSPLGSEYEYSISGTTYPGGATYNIGFQSSPVFNNLPWGDYTVTVKKGDCTSTSPNIIIQRFYPQASGHYADCFTETGSITVYAPFVAPQFEYSIDGINYISIPEGESNYVFEGLTVGAQYTIYLKDVVNDCVVTRTHTITEILQPVNTPVYTVTQPTCANPLGGITITSPISWLLNQFSIDGGVTYQNESTFENLPAGTYQLIVKRGIQCFSETVEVVLNSVETIDTPTVTVVQPTCENPFGSITVNPIANAYEYSINGTDYLPSHIFENLSNGTYQVTIKKGDCVSESVSVEINNSLLVVPTPEVTIVEPDCSDVPETGDLGTITVTYPLGANYEYSIDGVNYQSQTLFMNVNPGTYNLTVRETEQCVSEPLVIVIHEASVPEVIFSVTEPTCENPFGSITITSPVGNDFEYSVNGIDYQLSNVFENLVIGTYYISVKKGNCVSSWLETSIEDPSDLPTPEATFIPIICSTVPEDRGVLVITYPLGANYEYSIDGVNYQSSPLFQILNHNFPLTITVRLGVGCVSESLVINDNEGSSVPIADVSQPNCENEEQGTINVTFPLGNIFQYSIDGENYQDSPLFTDVPSGTYQLTFRLHGYCVSDPMQIIIDVPGLLDTPTFITTLPTCENPFGSITITSPISVTNEFPPRFEYSINGGVDYQYGLDFENLPSGTYYVMVRDRGGCVSGIGEVVLNQTGSIPEFAIVSECVDNSYTLKLEGIGQGNYQYLWNTGETTSSITLTEVGTYFVTVSLNGCSEPATIDVNSITCMIPKGISPNGDSLNDEFDLSGFGIVPKVQIFNRYGRIVYSQTNYTNQWKGQSDNNDELPSGTYYYHIEFQNGVQKTGWVYLNRAL